jgi:tripartite ATP-independent transporter DctM subunit
MSVEVLTILLFAMMILFLTTGLPIVFVLGSMSIAFAYLVMGPDLLGLVPSAMYRLMNTFTMLAIPLFILMAGILETSGVADDLYSMMQKWFGGIPGGLAVGTIVICTVFAAMSGVSAAAIVTMGIIALPSMIKRGYDKRLVMGCIEAGGGLGQLIPPSTGMIVWALWANESIGQMFIGGIIPGLILSALYIVYILIVCIRNPKLGPPLKPEERASWAEKMASLKAVILPVFLIIAVLGSMFGGIATPTEAAAIGALGAIVCALIYRKFAWKNLHKAAGSTLQVTCMVLWMMTAGACFAATFTAIGGQEFVTTLLGGLGVNRWVVFIGIQLIYILLGCFLDINAIMMLTIPVFVPVIDALGFNTLWFGVLFIVNMELGFLTPPFGGNLFYMKAVVPKSITMIDIYRSALPFIAIEAVALIICIVFPQTILWLPGLMFGK